MKLENTTYNQRGSYKITDQDGIVIEYCRIKKNAKERLKVLQYIHVDKDLKIEEVLEWVQQDGLFLFFYL